MEGGGGGGGGGSAGSSPSPRGDWYGAGAAPCFDLSRDPGLGLPFSAPGSPLLPGPGTSGACGSSGSGSASPVPRFKANTVSRTEGRRFMSLSAQPRLGDGIR